MTRRRLQHRIESDRHGGSGRAPAISLAVGRGRDPRALGRISTGSQRRPDARIESACSLAGCGGVLFCAFAVLSIVRRRLAGEDGFEPSNVGSKDRCLTTWRLPTTCASSYTARFASIPRENGFRIVRLRSMASLLDSAESVFRLVVEEAKEYAILLLDPSGRIESWNPGAPATGTGNRHYLLFAIAPILARVTRR
jgi:hypothetical protein